MAETGWGFFPRNLPSVWCCYSQKTQDAQTAVRDYGRGSVTIEVLTCNEYLVRDPEIDVQLTEREARRLADAKITAVQGVL